MHVSVTLFQRVKLPTIGLTTQTLLVGADDGHLHFEVAADGMCGHPRYCAQFPSLWSGCRLTHGVLRGQVGFEVRMEKAPMSPHFQLRREDEDFPGLRVGWSVAGSSTLLGKSEVT